jgi:hypothetical protein
MHSEHAFSDCSDEELGECITRIRRVSSCWLEVSFSDIITKHVAIAL